MNIHLSTWRTALRFTCAQFKGVLPKSNRSADSHVRALQTPLKTSVAGAAWNARTWRSALLRRALFSLALFSLAVPALATPLQLVTTIDPSVGPPASGGGNSMNPIIIPDGRYVLFASMANNLALTSSNTPFLAQSLPKINVFLRDRTNGTTTLVSINLAGTSGGNGDSLPIELSTNGQYALFESSASDLVPGDTNNVTDVFVRDLVNGTNILVSIGTDGSCANGVSGESAMTPDGRYVAFASTASNLVPDDTNGIQDIFVRDLQTGVTMLASSGAVNSYGALPSRSDSPQLTPDGRYVAFLSTATNLVPGVTTTSEVYVRDLTGAATYLVSSNAHTLIISNAISYNQAISDNGRFVAFESSTNGLSVGGVIQRYDLQSGFTDTVCSNAIAAPIGYPLFRNLNMTPDGRFIAFVAGTNSSRSGIYLWDAQTATTTLVSGNTNNAVPIKSICDWPVVDPSGRFVVFLSNATGLTTNAVAGGFHLYLRDLLAGTTTLLDADTNGFGFPKDFMNPARLTPDGRFLAFDCSDEYPATNIYYQPPAFPDRSLVPNDNNRAYDVFVRDLTTNSIELISVRQPALPSQSPSDSSPAMIFSVDPGGRYVAFASASTSLVANDTNTYRNVFVHDLLNGTNCLVSVDTNGLANANSMSTDPSISGDGRYVAFTSYASNLVAGYTQPPYAPNGIGSPNVFVRDLQTGITMLVSVSADGTSFGNSNSYSPVISADGRYVLFHSWANNLTTDEPDRPRENLSLRDLQVGTTYTLGYGSSKYYVAPTIMTSAMTPEGRFVAFYGYATPSSGTPYLFVWDSQAAALIYTNTTTGAITNLAISPDGNRIVFGGPGLYAVDRAANTNWQIASSLPVFRAGLQFSGDSRFLVYATTNSQAALDTNGFADVYLYDFVTSSSFLVSQGNPPDAASGPSDSPVISNNGRFVAYRSTATNLIASATNGLPNVFLYDQQTGTTTLLSTNASGMTGNNRSFAPQFSGDGQAVVFQSWASDLNAGDFNQVNDLFTLKIATSNSTPPIIAYPPNDQTVFVGENVTFAVTAWGTLPLSYQWNFNGTNISGATNISLTLTNVQLSQAGNYAVLVTNSIGSTLSSNAVLTVLAVPPAIDSQPANQSAAMHGTAIFSVTATGPLPLSYQWSFNGTNIAGATNTLLILTNIQLTQVGNYAVLVTNAFGSVLSSNAMLTVYSTTYGLVSWWPGEGNANDIAGTNNGTLMNGVGFVAGEVGQAFSFDGTSYVSIPDSPSLDGFTNRITIEAWIKVNQFPSGDWTAIVTKGDSSWRLHRYGSTSTIALSVGGLSNGNLAGTRSVNDGQWHHVAGVYDGINLFLYVDGTLDASAPATGIMAQNNYPVCIGENAQMPGRRWNGWIDEVSIYNRALTASEIQAIFAAGSGGKYLLSAPVIIFQPTNQTVVVGGTASFNVTATGIPPLSYQWNINGTFIAGATNTSLTLTNVQSSQDGNYAMLVTNAFGSTLSSNALLTVTLDHFGWGPIPSLRFINTPFAVAIQAQDLTNGIFTNFTGTAILGTTNGVAVTPSVSGNFLQGVWTGSVVISQTASNLVLQADDGLGHFGLANPINVINLPSLGMWHSGNIVLFMWPVGYSGFVLEASGNLSPATWAPIPYAPFQFGDEYFLPLNMTGTNGFYRLRFPGP